MITPADIDSDDGRWKAVVENNSNADGTFYYAVKTTGVFCRPSCAFRLPNRSNVEYFKGFAEAEAAGYRSCKKCSPATFSKTENLEQKIIHACRIIEQSVVSVKLKDLAAEVSLSPFHFHRLFKKIVGVTPKQYSAIHQSRRFTQSLKTSQSVTDAIYTAGYSSSSSAYDKNLDQLAMEPRVYRNGAVGITIIYGLAQCFLGWVIVAATDRGVCAIEFGDDPEALANQVQKRFPQAQLTKAGSGFNLLIQEVVDFIKTPEITCKIPLDIQGTVFQQRVWHLLRQIKPGKTLSYTELAERIGNPNAVRAVAQACAANKLAVVIPCHRVVSKDGKVSGYRWGVVRKKMLLKSEQDSSE